MCETELLLGCKMKNPKAQEELVKKYSKKLMAVARKYTKNYHDAEDVVQEGLINVLTRIDKYNGTGSFEGWIIRVTINVALKKYSTLSRKNEFSAELLEIDFDRAVPADAISELSYKEIINLVEKLPSGYKNIFNLCAIQGYTHDQVSEIVGIKSGTSRSQYTKARRYLQNLIKKK